MSLIGRLKSRFVNCKAGDYIRCFYKSDTQGVFGKFSLTEGSRAELPAMKHRIRNPMANGYNFTGSWFSTIVDGWFNFICIGIENGYKVFMPDRYIHPYITYEHVDSIGLTDKYNVDMGGGGTNCYLTIPSQKYLNELVPTLTNLSDDYRIDFGVIQLCHSVGGGYLDSTSYGYNLGDGVKDHYDLLEMTSTVNDDGTVRFISDYVKDPEETWLYRHSERWSVGYSTPRDWSKTYNYYYNSNVQYQSGMHFYSAIRPFLYVQPCETEPVTELEIY